MMRISLVMIAVKKDKAVSNVGIKKRAGESQKFSASYAREIQRNLNDTLKRLLNSLKGDITEDKINELILKNISSKNTKKIIDILVKEQSKAITTSANKVLRHLRAVQSGKKNVRIMSNLQAKKAHITNFNFERAKKELEKTLKQELAELKGKLAELRPNFQKDLQRRLKGAAGKITYQERTNKRILRELRASFRREIKKFSKHAALNSAGESLNKGEVLGMKAAKVRALKQWISRFDDKVRNWHDQVNFQTRKVKDRFSVPYPGGVDRLVAPKVAPISPANFFNCRCVVFYKTIKK